MPFERPLDAYANTRGSRVRLGAHPAVLAEPGPALHHVAIPGDPECLPMVASGTSTATIIG